MDSFLLVFVAIVLSLICGRPLGLVIGRWAGWRGAGFKRRREPIPGGLIAASMLLTLLKPAPHQPTQLPLPARNQYRQFNGFTLRDRIHSAGQATKPPFFVSNRPLPCPKAGGGRPATDCEQHGCCDQAPMDGFTAGL